MLQLYEVQYDHTGIASCSRFITIIASATSAVAVAMLFSTSAGAIPINNHATPTATVISGTFTTRAGTAMKFHIITLNVRMSFLF